ncbi:MAG TPA: aminopeptidase [Pyrinomonadaceae bacterium]|jgi:leucyl aminopeptidase (aminopeptidase T)
MKRLLAIAICIPMSAMLSCQVSQQQQPSGNTAQSNQNTSNTGASPASAQKKPPTDLEQLAQRLVNQSAGVKENDIVLISGGVRDLELLENIAVHVRKLGAFPLVSIDSDRMAKRSFTDVPEKYDSQTQALGMKLADIVNVTIGIDSNEAEGLLADIPPARLAARGKAGEPVNAQFLKNNVRQVAVGNNLYPTEWRARRYDMTFDELSKTFWEGVNVDYTSLQAKAEQVKAALSGNEVHVTNPNGTDLKVRIQGRPVYVSDGVISPEDAQKGGPFVAVYLPAGEVAVTPVPGTAEGKVVVDRDFFEGKEIQNLTITFAGGKITSMTGSGPGFEPFKADYEARGAGKELFAFIDLGINPNVRLSPNSKLGNWVPAGSVTVGSGNNAWAGGDNNVSAGWTGFLPGSTVTIDGKVVVEKGVLKV